jgi:hypothetical protein
MRRIILACALAGILGIPAKADETLKFRQSIHVTSTQSQQVGGVEGHVMSLDKFSGVAFLTDGSVGTVTGWGQSDFVKGSGTMNGYASLTFNDGSVLWLKWGTCIS